VIDWYRRVCEFVFYACEVTSEQWNVRPEERPTTSSFSDSLVREVRAALLPAVLAGTQVGRLAATLSPESRAAARWN